jgi:hypothetical protein
MLNKNVCTLDTVLSLSSMDNSFDLMVHLTGALQSGCRNIDDQWKQDAPELNFGSQSKGSELFLNLFLLCHCGIACRFILE